MNRKIILLLLCIFSIQFLHAVVFAEDRDNINEVFKDDEHTIALWKMNERQGQAVKDWSRNKNDALLGASDLKDEADPEWQKDNEANPSLCFDGKDDFMLIKNNESFNLKGRNGFTLECILKPTSKIDQQNKRFELVNKGYDSDINGGWTLNLTTSGSAVKKINFSFTASDGRKYAVTSSAPVNLPLDKWSYIAITADGKKLSVYLNGEKTGEIQCEKLPAANTASILIGKYISNKFHFAGNIKLARISAIAREITPLKIPENNLAILYESDFKEKKASDWKPSNGNWEIKNAEYAELSDKYAAKGFWTCAGDDNWKNYIFQADLRADDNFGKILMGFCWKDIDNHYELEYENQFSGLTVLRINKVINGTKTPIKSVSTSELPDMPFVGGSDKAATFKLEISEGTIILTIDGKRILTCNDNSFINGKIALGSNERKAFFSNVKVISFKQVPKIAMENKKNAEMSIDESDLRHVFEKGEKINLLLKVKNASNKKMENVQIKIGVNNGIRFTKNIDIDKMESDKEIVEKVVIETDKWKSGKYEVSAILNHSGKEQFSENYELTIVNNSGKDKFKHYVWGGEPNKIIMRDYVDHGLNGMMIVINPNDDFNESKKNLAPYFDEALKLGMDLGIHFPSNMSIPHGHPEVKVVTIDGKPGTLPNPWHPYQREFSLKKAHELIETFKVYPSFKYMLLTSENENYMEPSYSPADKARARKELGFDLPSPKNTAMEIDGTLGNVMKIPENIKKNQPNIFPDDSPWYKFKKWFWQSGFGDNVLNMEISKKIKEIRPDIETIHDPFRDVPLFKRNIGLDQTGTWFYSNPDPGEALAVSEVLIAAAKGDKTKISIGPSIWLYGGWICPSKNIQAGVQPADIIMEASWLCLSRIPEKIEYFGINYIMPRSDVEYKQPLLYEDLKRFSEKVLVPYGPTIKNLKRTKNECALLISMASQMFGPHSVWDWGTGSANGYYTALQMAHIPTSIVFEESVLNDDLDKYKILFMHNTDFLPQSVYEKILDFRKNGGIVVSGGYFADKIPGAVKFDMDFTKRLNYQYHKIIKGKGYTADVIGNDMKEKSTKLRDLFIDKVKPYADSDSNEVFLNVLNNGEAKYIFAVNDKRTFGNYVGQFNAIMEKGLPLKTRLSLQSSKGTVYDLTASREVKTELKDNTINFDIELEPAGGKIYMLTPEPLANVKIELPKTVKLSEKAKIKISFVNSKDKPIPAAFPLKVQILDSEGKESEYSGYYSTKNGIFELNMNIASNDICGKWQIKVDDLASGKSEATYIEVLNR